MAEYAYFRWQDNTELLSHLLRNLSRKVLVLLLQAFAGLETDELLNLNRCAVCLGNSSHVVCYALLAVLGLNVYLIQQAAFLQLFVDTSHHHAADDLVVGIGLLVLRSCGEDLLLTLDVLRVNLVSAGVQGLDVYKRQGYP